VGQEKRGIPCRVNFFFAWMIASKILKNSTTDLNCSYLGWSQNIINLLDNQRPNLCPSINSPRRYQLIGTDVSGNIQIDSYVSIHWNMSRYMHIYTRLRHLIWNGWTTKHYYGDIWLISTNMKAVRQFVYRSK
jgi:hypothetical protein